MGLVKPALSFELGLTAGFHDLLSTVVWTDITNYVLPWGTARGREAKKPPAHFDPGVANLTLDNRDRRFDPTNTAGPYSPNLKPARVRLRVRANYPSRLSPAAQDFESTASPGWTPQLNATVASTTAQARSGTRSASVTAVAGGLAQARIAAPASVTAGEQLTFLLSLRPATTTRNFTLDLEWHDASGAIISTAGSAAFTESAGAWVDKSFTATAPAGAVQAYAIVGIVGAAAAEVHYIDQASFHPGTSTTWTAPYDVFTGYVKRWPPEWTSTATSTVKITAVDALGAPLNLAMIYGSMWETVIRHDRPKVWLRLNETSGTLAADFTSNRLDGQYQGTPTLGQESLLSTEPGDKSVRFVSGSRVSLPYKNLISAYPFTLECWFQCDATMSTSKMILSAYDGPSSNWRQFLQVFISNDGGTTGKIVAVIVNPYPTGTQFQSTITVNDNARHHLAVVFTSSTSWKIFIDGTDRTDFWAANAHSFPNDLITGYAVGNNPAASFGDWRFGDAAGDLLDEVMVYDTALTEARIDKHYNAGVGYPGPLGASGFQVVRLLEEADWPADYDVDGGESILQALTTAGSVVANLQKIEDSEQGALFVDESGRVIFQGRHALSSAPYNTSQVTLEQGVDTLAYEPPALWGNDDAELFNLAAGARVGGPTYTVEDAASQAEYGTRALPAVTGLLNTDDQEVVDLLTYRVQKYSEPVSSVRQVRLHPAAVPELYPYVLGLGLRERITVNVAPPGGGPVFSQESHIERISHEVDASGDWWTVWDVSAADAASYWVLDDPVLGLLDSGNRLAL